MFAQHLGSVCDLQATIAKLQEETTLIKTQCDEQVAQVHHSERQRQAQKRSGSERVLQGQFQCCSHKTTPESNTADRPATQTTIAPLFSQHVLR